MKAQNFQAIGPTLTADYNYTSNMSGGGGAGKIESIVFDPLNSEIMYACGAYTGIWKSIDGAGHWSKLGTTETQLLLNSVASLVIDPVNTAIMYVATGRSYSNKASAEGIRYDIPSDGIYKSVDGGLNWNKLSNFSTLFAFNYNDDQKISRLAINPFNSNILYASTSRGLYKSTNAGLDWTLVFVETELPTAENFAGFYDVVCSQNNSNTVYVSGNDVYKSVDGGSSFASMTHNTTDLAGVELPVNLKCINSKLQVIDDGSADIVYANMYTKNTSDQAHNRLYYFDGTAWSADVSVFSDSYPLLNGKAEINSGWLVFGVADNASSTSYFKKFLIQGTIIAVYDNDLTTGLPTIAPQMVNSIGLLHDDMACVVFKPNTDIAFFGNDGGVYKDVITTTTSGSYVHTITEQNLGMNNNMVHGISISKQSKNKVLAGIQDNSCSLFDAGVWKSAKVGGDGYIPILLDEYDDDISYFGINELFDHSPDNLDHVGEYVQCEYYKIFNMYQMPGDANTMLTGRTEVLKFDKTPPSFEFTRISNFFSTYHDGITAYSVIKGMDIYKNNPDIIYVAYGKQDDLSYLALSKVFKTTTGGMSNSPGCTNIPSGPSWTELPMPQAMTGSYTTYFPTTVHYPNTKYYNITDIIVSSKNPNHVWISYDHLILNKTELKIYETMDGGLTWNSYQTGLPERGITKLVYADGSNDALYCGTTDGRIYYRDASMSAWVLFNQNLAHNVITGIEIDYCEHKLYVSTYGAGVWKGDLYSKTDYSDLMTLEGADGFVGFGPYGSLVWNTNTRDILKGILIKTGQSLTINNSTLRFAPGARIIVQKGGYLKVEATSYLTSSCGDLWSGIIVEGDANELQPTQNQIINHDAVSCSKQGVVFIQASYLLHMKDGVFLGKPSIYGSFSSVDLMGNGGVLYATGSHFNENKNSIVFSMYAKKNQSAIKDCEFINEQERVYHNIGMWAVNGVSIYGNKFLNTSPFCSSLRGSAIQTYDAAFNVFQLAGTAMPNTFDGYYRAIRCENTTGFSLRAGTTKINKNLFGNNEHGIYMQGVFGDRITDNDFINSSVPYCVATKPFYAVYQAAGFAYKIENNRIQNNASIPGGYTFKYGILCNNGNRFNTEVRRNDIDGLTYAVNAVGDNGGDFLLWGFRLSGGLLFTCNNFTNNIYSDIGVWQNLPTSTNGSIRAKQGTGVTGPMFDKYSSAANNRFKTTSVNYHLYHSCNNDPFTYYYIQRNTLYSPFSQPTKVLPFYFGSPPIPCGYRNHTYLPLSGTYLDVYETICPDNVLFDDFSAKMRIAEIKDAQNFLIQKIDGGNKNYLLSQLTTATASNIQAIYLLLYSKDAITEDVLNAAIANNYADEALNMLKDIIIKNSGLEDTTVEVLINAALAFSAADIDQLEAVQNKVSPKDILLGEISGLEAEKDKLIDELYYYYSDSLMDDSIEAVLLSDTSSIRSKVLLLSYYISMNEYAKASAFIPSIEADENYLQVQNFVNLCAKKIELEASGQSWMDISATDETDLLLLSQGEDMAAAMARSVLHLARDIDYEEYLPTPNEQSNKMQPPIVVKENLWAKLKIALKEQINLVPNPASEFVEIQYKKLAGNTQFTVYTSSMQAVFTTMVAANSSNYRLETKAWPEGIYFIRIDGSNRNHKLVITH